MASPLLRAAGGGFWCQPTCEDQEAVLVVSHFILVSERTNKKKIAKSSQRRVLVETHLLRAAGGGFGGSALAQNTQWRVWW